MVLVARERHSDPRLVRELRLLDPGLAEVVAGENGLESLPRPAPSTVVVSAITADELTDLLPKIKRRVRCPVLVVVSAGLLESIGPHLAADDFAESTASGPELRARIRRLLSESTDSRDVVHRGALVINTATCEVTLDGRLVELTYKEYELLKFLASRPARVHTREALLNSVWGYDYYGGDRTVDVHVRRLRSKIEDAEHTFIDTVRNIGYRFRKQA
ncbi:MAG: response regulator transcription factor [Chloroflexi bacterium]|nr:response regulator transcription factor [Chloroflexota bacterium]